MYFLSKVWALYQWGLDCKTCLTLSHSLNGDSRPPDYCMSFIQPWACSHGRTCTSLFSDSVIEAPETLKNPFDTPWTGHIWVAKAERDRVHFNENWAVSQLEFQRETGPVWLTLLSSALLWQAPSFTEVCTCNNKAPFLSSHLVAWDLPDLMFRCLHLFLLSFSFFLVALHAIRRVPASLAMLHVSPMSVLSSRHWQTGFDKQVIHEY